MLSKVMYIAILWLFSFSALSDCLYSEKYTKWDATALQQYHNNKKSFFENLNLCVKDKKDFSIIKNLIDQSLADLVYKQGEEQSAYYAFNKSIIEKYAMDGVPEFQHLFAWLHYPDNTLIRELEPRDYYTFIYWEKMAAASGNVDAIFSLANMVSGYRRASPDTFLPYLDITPSTAIGMLKTVNLNSKDIHAKHWQSELDSLIRMLNYKNSLTGIDVGTELIDLKKVTPKEQYKKPIWLKGTIGSSPITMVFTERKNNVFTGYYFYDSAYKKWHSSFRVEAAVTKQNMVITATDKVSKATEKFELNIISMDNGQPYYMQGKWLVADKQEDVQLGNVELYDEDFSCAEMEKAPGKIFTSAIDLGSGGNDQATNVDHSCKNSINNLQFAKKANELASTINSPPPSIAGCGGSITYMHMRYMQYLMAMAGYAPDIFVEKYGSAFVANRNYLKSWSNEQIYNKTLFDEFIAELEKVRPQFKQFYAQNYNLTPDKADLNASAAINVLIYLAAGQGSKTILPSEIIQSYDKSGMKALTDNTVDQYSLVAALNYSLLNHYPDDIFNYLLSKISDLNYGDESPLFYALHDFDRLQVLLAKGANINYQNGYGKTVLYYAIQENNLSLVKYLVEHGAAVNNHYKTSKEIIAAGGTEWDYICIQKKGRTPLMHAAQHASLEIIKYLIAKGADIKAKDELNNTAVDYVDGKERNAIADFLRSEIGK